MLLQLRPLTDDEKQVIREARERVKTYLKPLQNEARSEFRKAISLDGRDIARWRIAYLKPPDAPVRLFDPDTFQCVLVDYNELRKFIASLAADIQWHVDACITDDEQPALVVNYYRDNPKCRGQLRLHGLSHCAVLEDVPLPAISI